MKKMLVTSFVMLMVLAGVTSAAVLRVDFNGQYGSEPDNAVMTYDGAGLLGTGTFWNGAKVWDPAGGEWSYNQITEVYPGPTYLLGDGVTDAQITITLGHVTYGDHPSDLNNKLFVDYICSDSRFTTDGLSYIDITVSGLIPGNSYTLAGYGSHTGTLGVGGIWTANGVGPMDLSSDVADSGILENVIADINGVIAIHVDHDTSFPATTVVNGLELEVVPEPLTIGLLSLGGLALLRRRR